MDLTAQDVSHESDGDDSAVATVKQSRFKKPFKIYENFRSVYRGVQRKGRSGNFSQCYDLTEAAQATCSTPSVVPIQRSPSLSETSDSSEDCRKKKETFASLESTASDDDDKKKSPSVDGNATDDSGIDSICYAASPVTETPPDPVYSTVSLADKTRNKMKANEAVLKVVDGIDIGEKDIPVTVNEQKYSLEDIQELTTLLNNTTALLNRNSSLRASLTISVKKSGKSNEQTFILPNQLPKEPEKEEENYPSLVDLDGPANPSFVRHNPIRRPVSEVKAPDSVCRKSIRLAPKTVANLASKFDGLLDIPAATSAIPEKERQLCKKDITKIIGTLNKLDEDAKRSCYRPRPMTTSSENQKNFSVGKTDREVRTPGSPCVDNTTELEIAGKATDGEMKTDHSPTTPQEKTSLTDKYLQSLAVKSDFEEKTVNETELVTDVDDVSSKINDDMSTIQNNDYSSSEEEEGVLATARPAVAIDDEANQSIYESISGSIDNSKTDHYECIGRKSLTSSDEWVDVEEEDEKPFNRTLVR